MSFKAENDHSIHRVHHHTYCSEVGFRKQLQELIRTKSWNSDREQLRCDICNRLIRPPKWVSWYNHISRALWVPLAYSMVGVLVFLGPQSRMLVLIASLLCSFFLLRRFIPITIMFLVEKNSKWEEVDLLEMEEHTFLQLMNERNKRYRIIELVVAVVLFSLAASFVASAIKYWSIYR